MVMSIRDDSMVEGNGVGLVFESSQPVPAFLPVLFLGHSEARCLALSKHFNSLPALASAWEEGTFYWQAVCLFLGETEGRWDLPQWEGLFLSGYVNVWNVPHPPVWFLADWVFPSCLAWVSTIQLSSHIPQHICRPKRIKTLLKFWLFSPFEFGWYEESVSPVYERSEALHVLVCGSTCLFPTFQIYGCPWNSILTHILWVWVSSSILFFFRDFFSLFFFCPRQFP